MSLQLLALSLICCNKQANSKGNKAFVNVTHTAYNTGPLTLEFESTPLFTTPISYGQTTQNANGLYDTTTAGVQDLQIFQGTNVLLSGNTALQQAAYYSLFVYDTLDQTSLGVIILQNNQGARTDTLTYIRFLNFTPGSAIGVVIVYPRDTTGLIKASYRDTVTISPSLFVGNNPNPSAYPFNYTPVHIGKNDIYAFVDTTSQILGNSHIRFMGSLQFDSTINYNVFLQGFPDSTSGVDTFRVNSVPVN